MKACWRLQGERDAKSTATVARRNGTRRGSRELVDRSRPALVQQPRQRAIGEDARRRSGSARNSCSRSRRRRCAARARRTPGTACRICRARPFPGRNAVTFSGNAPPASSRSRSIHSASTARVASKSRAISASVELCGQRQRRQPRAVQDLVRVGVADAAEQARIGQRALERVVLAREARGERLEVGVERLRARRDRASRAPPRRARRAATRAAWFRPR